ncbi:MAG: ActD-like protein [Myxococcota bacterium]
MNITPPRLRDWDLERLLLQELPPQQAQQLEALVAQQPTLQDTLAHMQQQNTQLLENLPPDMLAREVRRRWAQGQGADALARSARRRWVPALLMAGILTCVVLPTALRSDLSALPGGQMDVLRTDAPDQTRIKGLTPELRVFRLEGERITRLLDQAKVPPAALIQLSYLSPAQPYGVIVSVDGAGNVTLHAPSQAHEQAKLEPNGEHHLAHAFELDAAPGFERFFLVSSPRPLEVSRVLNAAKRLALDPQQARNGSLQLPSDLQQTSILLEKEIP